MITFGRIRIAEDADETTAMAISAAAALVIFLSVVFTASALAMTWTTSHLWLSAFSLGRLHYANTHHHAHRRNCVVAASYFHSFFI